MDFIITIPDDAIRTIINDCLKNINLQSKQELPAPSPQPEIEKPISTEETIEFLGKSRQTITKWRREGRIKGRKLGGRIYFLRSELIAAMK